MKKATLLSLVTLGIIRTIGVVRANSNGYLYCNVMDVNGRTQNIYFGQKTSEKVALGEKVDIATLKQLECVVATNAAGEQRVKFSLPGESTDRTDLAAAFGVVAPVVEDVPAVVAAMESQWTQAVSQTAPIEER